MNVRSLRTSLAAALICLAWGSAIEAQTTGVMLPVPPLATIGLPLPRIGLPPLSDAERDAQARHADDARVGRPDHHRGTELGRVVPTFLPVFPIVIVSTSSASGAPASQATPGSTSIPQALATGTLWLDIKPSTNVQVFVDGFYVGTADELARGLELEAGPHRVELRASGFEGRGFDVMVRADQLISYRDSLKLVTSSDDRSESSVGARDNPGASRPDVHAKRADTPRVLYVIPGCYAGNVLPAADVLPAGCDVSRLQILPR